MEHFMLRKIEQDIKDRKSLHQTFVENAKSYRAFLEFEKKAFEDGALK